MRKPHKSTRKHNAKGRSKSDGRFIKLSYWLLDSLAWKSLKPAEVCVYLALAKRYNSYNNGRIGLSCRAAALNCHIGKDTACRAFKVLAEKGFIKQHFPGSFSQKKPLASEWELTQFETDGKPATKEFMDWRPGTK